MKKLRICFVVCFLMLGLTACNTPDGPKKLISDAQAKYGSATVVGKYRTKDGWTVTLHDDLQDFNYTVTSFKGAWRFWVPGQPGTRDDFTLCLIDEILKDNQVEIANIEQTYKAGVSPENAFAHINIKGTDPTSAKQAASEVAEIFQRNNLDHRLDGLEIEAIAPNQYDYERIGYATNETVGTYTLPNMIWSGKEVDELAKYTEEARFLDPAATFLRSEEVLFSETGYKIHDVSGYPCYEDSPVTLYYFEASDGGIFYVADFYVFYENDRTIIHVANNYEDRTYGE